MKVKAGDMVMITNMIPEWQWLPFKEGDVGIIVFVEDIDYSFRMCDVHFFRLGKIEAIPEYFLKILE